MRHPTAHANPRRSARVLCRTLVAVAVAGALLPGAARAQSLRGSRGSIERMYDAAVDARLDFLRTPGEVRAAAREGTLVPLATTSNYRVHRVSAPYVLPSTRDFVDGLAADYRRECGEPMVVTSAVRPSSRQPRNATARSVHPTGLAVDLRRPRSGHCRSWLRGTLLSLEADGVIEATEERRPAHFHIAVLPRERARGFAGRSRSSGVSLSSRAARADNR